MADAACLDTAPSRELPGDPGDLPPPFISIGVAVQRLLETMCFTSEARLADQIQEVFGE
ncbi:hypothetical protein VQH23_16120 [Pararoseomonas sp. SCSIO 73927]|uniref:hypothetical protein n=1 Tax=Pararoseomonas sp. SCSIO 73927 TaxID=3114537 RepID=UPI0030CC1997